MNAFVVPAVAAVLVWWVSTGIVLWLNHLPGRARGWALAGASALAVGALALLALTSSETTPGAAYGAFLAGLVLWGWHELTFLQGLITGPRKTPCPTGAGIGERFRLAAGALLYHELAIALTLLLVAAVTWGDANQVGLLTFFILFCMRLSAKMNVFLGVPHLTEEFLPQSLEFLKSYFGRRPINGLFPISITVSTLLAAYVFHKAAAAGTDFDITAWTLLGTLIVLGTLEHWLLVLPLRDSQLWRWAVPGTEPDQPGDDEGLRSIGGSANRGGVETVSVGAIPREGRIP